MSEVTKIDARTAVETIISRAEKVRILMRR